MEDRVAQLCIGEHKHERAWNIRDAAREKASVGKDELTHALPPARPERCEAAAVPAMHECSRTGGAHRGPGAPPLAGEVGHHVLSQANVVGPSTCRRRSGRPPPTLETTPQRC
jgi:hypothetical protein